MSQPSHAARFPVEVVLVGALLVGGVCLGIFLFWAALRGREEARSAACHGRLYSLGAALRLYHTVHGTHPPVDDEATGDAPAVSWRVLVLAVATGEEDFMKYRVDEPWNSPENQNVLGHMHRHVYLCESDPASEEAGITSYLAVVGPGSVWSEVRAGHISDPEEEVPEKILLIEVPDSGIYWTEPRDISVDEAIALFRAQKALRKHRHKKGLHFLTAGGTVHSFSEVESVEELANLLRVTMSDTENPGPTD